MIFDILELDKWHGCSKRIDIAKGINKIPENYKEAKDQIQRQWLQKK